MEELKSILRDHALRYPKMEPTDSVKLIYQNEFGGGHLIRDTESCLRYLRREYAQTPHEPFAPIYEEIGNGIVRVNLAALHEDQLEKLGIAFIRSANARKGNQENFLEKLALLRQLTVEGLFSFDLAALDAYLSDYEQAGFPPVSHSEAYGNAYRPAYRIVLKEYLE